MRISSGRLIGSVLAALLLSSTAAASASFESPESAYEEGYRAFQAGDYDHAIDPLAYAAEHGEFLGRFYLAKILSTNGSRHVDHAAAFRELERLVEDNSGIDYAHYRAPYVASAIVALARYWRSGVPGLGIEPDTQKVYSLLATAANYFGDADAQFELAKYYVEDGGSEADIRHGLKLLVRLAEKKGHPGSQAYLAEIFHSGRPIGELKGPQPALALALITLAVERASEDDRIGFEDTYQAIFCATSLPQRVRAARILDDLRRVQSKSLEARSVENVRTAVARYERSRDIGIAVKSASRSCEDGSPIELPIFRPNGSLADPPSEQIAIDKGAAAIGAAMGVGLVDVPASGQ